MTVEIGPRQEKVSSRGEPTRLAFYDIGRILSVRHDLPTLLFPLLSRYSMKSPASETFLPLLQTVFTASSCLLSSPQRLTLSCFGQSILEVFLLCCSGYIMARVGILDKKTQKARQRIRIFCKCARLICRYHASSNSID